MFGKCTLQLRSENFTKGRALLVALKPIKGKYYLRDRGLRNIRTMIVRNNIIRVPQQRHSPSSILAIKVNVRRKGFLRCVILTVVVSAVWKLTIDTYLNLADTGV